MNFEKDALVSYILQQNEEMFDENVNYEVLSVKPLKTTNKVFQALVQVDVNSYHNIMKAGKLLIGLNYCSVYDAIELRRCFKCCGLHHYSDKCSSEVHVCPKCSDNHPAKDCNSSELKCTLCCGLKDTNIDTSHAAWDLSKCTAYKNAHDKFKSLILGTK